MIDEKNWGCVHVLDEWYQEASEAPEMLQLEFLLFKPGSF